MLPTHETHLELHDPYEAIRKGQDDNKTSVIYFSNIKRLFKSFTNVKSV